MVCAAEAEQQHVSALAAIMQMLHKAITAGCACPACPGGHSCHSLWWEGFSNCCGSVMVQRLTAWGH